VSFSARFVGRGSRFHGRGRLVSLVGVRCVSQGPPLVSICRCGCQPFQRQPGASAGFDLSLWLSAVPASARGLRWFRSVVVVVNRSNVSRGPTLVSICRCGCQPFQRQPGAYAGFGLSLWSSTVPTSAGGLRWFRSVAVVVSRSSVSRGPPLVSICRCGRQPFQRQPGASAGFDLSLWSSTVPASAGGLRWFRSVVVVVNRSSVTAELQASLPPSLHRNHHEA
jgi:hypothetical protein